MRPTQKLKSTVSKFPEIELAILYGSYAKGRETAKSDYDIAIAGKTLFTDDRKIELTLELSKELGKEVDLLDLSSAHGVILKEALTKGQLLFVRDKTLYAALIRRFWFEQADFEPLRRRILEARRERFLK